MKMSESSVDIGYETHEREREEAFHEIFRKQELEIFYLKGLRFPFFNSRHIKFVFTPSEIVECVSKSTKFIATVYYLKKHHTWNISGRNILPQTYRARIYELFGLKSFTVDDDNICDVIIDIYNYLKRWSIEYHNFKINKYEAYLDSGNYLLLDKEDYEIFLDEEERQQLIDKRKIIHQRMIPPNKPALVKISDFELI